jgi:hypothetical protein
VKHGLILALLALTGCATLERHPIATAVIVGIAAGSIAASDSHRTEQPRAGITRPECSQGACQ